MDQDPRIKNLKIKTGVLKRVSKEKTSYEREVVSNENKLEKMIQEGKDEYDIKKQNEIIDESKTMVNDCRRRLEAAYEQMVQILENEADLADTDDYKTAKALVDEIKL
ncbi:tubulin-specific chaperone A-like [Dysidea avara]|uniref:tubulin-specific chaperone A-like n=1 Tax=Dysidea avara TaxID=196820 RepID=UPI0033229DD1